MFSDGHNLGIEKTSSLCIPLIIIIRGESVVALFSTYSGKKSKEDYSR